MDRIDYEKMAKVLTAACGIHTKHLDTVARYFRCVALDAAEARANAIEQVIADDITATTKRANNAKSERARDSYESQRATLLRVLAAVRETKLITESEAANG